MNLQGKLHSISRDWKTDELIVAFTIPEAKADEVEQLRFKLLDIVLKPFTKRRSRDANAMLWACIGEIAAALGADKWDVYLFLLRRYGVFTEIHVNAADVERVKAQWRETEVIGGEGDEVEMLCYFGSHTYTTAEFSRLLEGTISEMKEMGLEIPASAEMRRALEKWSIRNPSSPTT